MNFVSMRFEYISMVSSVFPICLLRAKCSRYKIHLYKSDVIQQVVGVETSDMIAKTAGKDNPKSHGITIFGRTW